MNKLPQTQQRAAVILCLVVLVVFMILMAFINISVFFVFLVAIILGICILRVKKPQFFQLFAKAPKATDPDKSVKDEQKRDVFSTHIILLYQGGMTMQQISVDRQEFTIGRSETCNFVLSGNTDISRIHAIIHYDEERGCSTIMDNHSSHGTKVNGTYLNPGEARTLHNGDLIQIEDRVLTVQNKNY